MGLKQYNAKRDFSKTAEPSGQSATKTGRDAGRMFVVQKHDATRLHYDFRLELDGVLKSWAVPKGPSLNPADKRLAVEVEDHPIAYAEFEGIIPKGQYGGGTVMVWDRGVWTTGEKNPAAALKRGKLTFTLDGEKLHGEWTLTRLRDTQRTSGGKHNWLLIKRTDDQVRTDGQLVDEQPLSVKTGRDLGAIAQDADAEWTSHASSNGTAKRAKHAKKKTGATKKPAAWSKAGGPSPDELATVEGARASRMLTDLTPQLCTLSEKVPRGDGWLHEIKFDGYRLLAYKDAGSVRLITRNGNDWTRRFGPIAGAVAGLPCGTAVVDGEATIVGESGRTTFQALQQAMKAQTFDALVFFVFDLLYLDGYDLTRTPLVERKRLLKRLLDAHADDALIRYSDHVVGGGASVRESACQLALEGVISKKADAPYVQGRSRTWVKVKCGHRQEFVVIGYTDPSGSRKHFGSLVFGVHDAKGRFIYAGRAGTGYDAAALKQIGARLAKLKRARHPLDVSPPRAKARGVHWVEPELVAEVSFTQWTHDGRLRHPVFEGLREDKKPEDVRIETPGHGGARAVEEAAADEVAEIEAEEPQDTEEEDAMPPAAAEPGRKKQTKKKGATKAASRTPSPRGGERAARSTKSDRENVVAGIAISSPDRVVFPDAGLTKLDLVRYYESVAEWILPYVADRPLSVVRCPQGRAKQCFFQKHLADTFAEPVFGIRVKEEAGEADYLGIDSVGGLVSLIQFGVIEIHPWGARRDQLDKPDLITFDLDPSEEVGFDAVKEGAAHVKALLDEAGLVSYLKTSGGKGLHVVAPLTRKAEWDEAKAFAHAVALRMAGDRPDRYLAVMSKAKRRGKVFVDYLRNGRGATSVAPYSVRARAGAPVSMPIAWEELFALESPAAYTVRNTAEHLTKRKTDPWADFFSRRQQITASKLRTVRG